MKKDQLYKSFKSALLVGHACGLALMTEQETIERFDIAYKKSVKEVQK